MKRAYQLIEHTADTGIRVRSFTLAGLFVKAALAIAGLSSQRISFRYPEKHKIEIAQRAADTEELFVNWLNELLSLSAAESLVFEGIKIKQFDGKYVEAVAIGSDMRDYKIDLEIKAATYHQLKIAKAGFMWQAEVIFDV